MVSIWSLSPGLAVKVNVTDSPAARAGPSSGPPGDGAAPDALTFGDALSSATISSGDPSSAIRSVPLLANSPVWNIGFRPENTAKTGGESGTVPITRPVFTVPGVDTFSMVTVNLAGPSSMLSQAVSRSGAARRRGLNGGRTAWNQRRRSERTPRTSPTPAGSDIYRTSPPIPISSFRKRFSTNGF